MKFYRIKITSWRDRPAERRPTKDATALAEISADVAKIERDLTAEKARKDGDLELVKVLDAARTQLHGKRLAVVATEEERAIATERAAELHPKVGAIGYQVVDDKRMVVERLVDEQGNDFPAGAVFEYDIDQVDAPEPAWAAAKAAEWEAVKDARIKQLIAGG